MTVELPVELPIDFSQDDNGDTITLPVTLPMSFADSTEIRSVTLPITLPMVFESNKSYTVKLPATLPLRFEKAGTIRKAVLFKYKETVNLNQYQGTSKFLYKEKAIGKTAKFLYKETGWWFPGLILEENIISKQSAQLSLTENIQSLILVDFELVSSNTLKINWYGNSVPSFTIMKKSSVDDNYIADGTYSWTSNGAKFDIESEDYDVYLLGASNSGKSAIYTIAGVNDLIIEPTVDVSLNEKIYELEIDNTSKYYVEVNY